MPVPAAWRRLGAAVPLMLAATLTASVVLTPTVSAAASELAAVRKARSIEAKINQAANVAISHIGDPYRYGAAGPHAFDCSGLSMWSYGHSQLRLPRTSAAQYAAVRHILKKNMIRGDLVFFHDSSGRIYHVGIFLYWNQEGVAVIVHAPRSGSVVHRQPVWTSAWYAGTRRP